MKKTIFLSFAMAVITVAGFAQTNVAGSPKGGQNLSAEERAKQQTDKINEMVKLSPDQYSKVLALSKASIKEREAIRASGATGDDVKAKLKASNDDKRTKLKAILTPEQNQKLEDMKKQQQGMHGNQ